VDLFAPGEQIFSTVHGIPAYAKLSGTSQAAPLVAAAAALIESQDPQSFGPNQLKDALLEGTDLLPYLGTLSQSGGRLNAARSMFTHSGQLNDGYLQEKVPWKSCDTDHDGFHESQDQCPDAPGPLAGCPDFDADGITDANDNCVHDGNPQQENADGDALGDVCDGTPRGPDFDGDRKGSLDDKCPTQFAETDDGCPKLEPTVSPTPTPRPRIPQPPPGPSPTPTPVPAAKIVSLHVKVTPRRCPAKRKCKKSAKVTVKLTRTAKVALRVERRVRSHWRRVTLRSLTATASGRSLTVRGTRGSSLKKGSYRVIATIAGGGDVCKFKV
jgi:hypothetical protein